MSLPSEYKVFAPFEWLIALRYLRARRQEGFISVIAGFSFLGIMLGVATLIIVMAVMNGFRKDLFSKILGLNGHIIIYKIGEPFSDYSDKVTKISKAFGVKNSFPLIEGQVLVSSNGQSFGGLVRGMAENDIKALNLVSDNIHFGTLNGFDNSSSVAIGMRLAKALYVNIGDKITLVTPRGASTPFGIAPRSKSYIISAIFELGMSEYDKSIIFMPLKEAQKYFSKPNEVDVLEVVVEDPAKIDTYISAIKDAAGPTLNVSDWRQKNETFFTVLEIERNVMFIILSLIILVAALNIISGMMMLVKDKGRDIAVLRTMGATKSAVMRVFLITGASIGILGTIAGLFLGVIFCHNIENIRQGITWITGTPVFDPNVYYLTRLPAELNPIETFWIVIMALSLSILATLYPSWRASKLDPVEALRYE
ncbi:MAG: lipoprotein-releasing ABC transporter permease subunit [Hyphomicrobium sp.]